MIPLRDLNPTRTTPWVTWSLLLLCILVFLFQVVQPPSGFEHLVLTWGLTPRRLTHAFEQGDPLAWLTVLSSMFMHGGWLHMGANLWFLRIFGDNVEENMGPVRYTIFYLLCGLGAACAQWAIGPESSVPMVGASGAIAGVLAAYCVLYPKAKVLTLVPIAIFIQIVELPAWLLIAVWFVLQFFSGVSALGPHAAGGGVAYWAHIGGFLVGLITVFFLRRPKQQVEQPEASLSAPADDYARWRPQAPQHSQHPAQPPQQPGSSRPWDPSAGNW